MEHSPPPLKVAHPPTSPPLADYLQSFEAIPHIAIPPSQDGQYVRPIGESGAIPTDAAASHVVLPPQRNVLKRSSSAPDVHLALRALRKAARKAKPLPAAAVRVREAWCRVLLHTRCESDSSDIGPSGRGGARRRRRGRGRRPRCG